MPRTIIIIITCLRRNFPTRCGCFGRSFVQQACGTFRRVKRISRNTFDFRRVADRFRTKEIRLMGKRPSFLRKKYFLKYLWRNSLKKLRKSKAMKVCVEVEFSQQFQVKFFLNVLRIYDQAFTSIRAVVTISRTFLINSPP